MIAITYTRNDEYNHRMATGLASGFKELGKEVSYVGKRTGRYPVNVQVLIEINGQREKQKNVKHVTWIQDPGQKDIDSDLVFFIHRPEAIGYKNPPPYSLLYTGFNPVEFRPVPHFDFLMVGYIPQPTPAWAYSLQAFKDHHTPLHVVIPRFTELFRDYNSPILESNWGHVKNVICKIRKELGLEDDWEYDPSWPADAFLQEYIPRTMDRYVCVWAALQLTKSLKIYGIADWAQYNEFAPYYCGENWSEADLQANYKAAKLTLHTNVNGFGMHSRVIDCMGAGGTVFALETPDDKLEGGIASCFEPFVDYIPFNFTNIETAWTKKVGGSARDKIYQSHLWRHRALEILQRL